ncbi:MAG: hypothetical protein M3R72_00840 [Bacteroidota bacterium]|nr:hypothetical protein [Bacteroidota bacterium]
MNSTEENISLERSNKVDVYTQENINHYYRNKNHIENRLRQLEKETSIEQIFQLHDAANVIAGVLLSVATRKQKWLILPILIAIVQSVQTATGQRLGTSLLRKYGFRTKDDIDKEKYALKALRGDFHYEIEVPNAVWEAVNK